LGVLGELDELSVLGIRLGVHIGVLLGKRLPIRLGWVRLTVRLRIRLGVRLSVGLPEGLGLGWGGEGMRIRLAELRLMTILIRIIRERSHVSFPRLSS